MSQNKKISLSRLNTFLKLQCDTVSSSIGAAGDKVALLVYNFTNGEISYSMGESTSFGQNSQLANSVQRIGRPTAVLSVFSVGNRCYAGFNQSVSGNGYVAK